MLQVCEPSCRKYYIICFVMMKTIALHSGIFLFVYDYTEGCVCGGVGIEKGERGREIFFSQRRHTWKEIVETLNTFL